MPEPLSIHGAPDRRRAVTAPEPHRRSRVAAALAALAALALLAGACGSTTAPNTPATAATEPPAPASSSSTAEPTTTTAAPSTAAPSTAAPSTAAPSTTAPTTTTTAAPATTAPPTTPTTAAPATDVRAAQDRLMALGYWLGSADGKLGSDTVHAITAFQKVEGLKRTGKLDAATVARLAVAGRPSPRHPAARAVEVDRTHQVLLAVHDGATQWVLDISTGKPSTPTPAGTFHVTWQVDGIRDAPLGRLYRPKYFNEGIALHGYTSVPTYPASHGCVRLTYRAMDFVWSAGLAPIGTQVTVY